jgi:hypothetical protein
MAIVVNPELGQMGFADSQGRIEKTQIETRASGGKLEIPTTTWVDDKVVAEGFAGGTGTEEDPYLIETPEQLGRFAYNINHNSYGDWHKASYKLMSDIDLEGHAWMAVGRDGATHGDGGRIFTGRFDGNAHTINNMYAVNHERFTDGRISGFIGIAGDGAIVQNVVFTNAVSTLRDNYYIKDERPVSVAIVIAETKRNANVYIASVYVVDGVVLTPPTGDELFGNAVNAGVFLGKQAEGDGTSGKIHMYQVHAIGITIAVNIRLDKDWWSLTVNTIVHTVGGLVGRASLIDIADSSFDGLVGLEAVRINRNLDNWRITYHMGGAIGLLEAINDREGNGSHIYNVVIGAGLYLDTFDVQESTRSARTTRASENANVADIRHVGGVIGNANATIVNANATRGSVELFEVEASVLVEAPKADTIISQSRTAGAFGTRLLDEYGSIEEAKEHARAYKAEHDEENKAIIQSRLAQFAQTGNRVQSRFATGAFGFAWIAGGSYTIAAGSTAASTITVGSSAAASTAGLAGVWSGAAALATAAIVAAIILVVIVIIVILVFAILFAIWAALRPAWESHVHVGSAIGSQGRQGIVIGNTKIANSAVQSNTMFSAADNVAEVVNSNNTSPTLAMIIEQPKSQPVENIGDKVVLDVQAQGTIMSDGTAGVDSQLSYQWYYNTIDSNDVLTGEEEEFNGVKTEVVEGATSPSLQLDVNWVGVRYYFVVVTNNVLQFKGSNPSITARVGNRDISVGPARVTEQPQDTSINVNTAGKLRVAGEASGTITYQWYVNTVKDTNEGVLLAGASGQEFAPVHTEAGVYYYYAVLTVSVDAIGSNEPIRKDTYSAIATVSVQANATAVEIASQPVAYEEVKQHDTVVLGVEVDLDTVNGQLSYQWYKATGNDTSNGVAIANAVNQSYRVDTAVAGTHWYYVVVSNTVQDSVKSVTSNISQVRVESAPKVVPTIHELGNNTVTMKIGEVRELQVYVVASGAKLSYQWYENTTSSNIGGSKIPGATNPNYIVISDVATTKYYYAVATTTTTANAEASLPSNPFSVTVQDPNQRALSIIGQPKSVKGSMGDKIELSVTPERRGGSMNYQWYESAYIDGRDAKAIHGAIGNVWRVSSKDMSNKYYFAVVNNAVDVSVMTNNRGISVRTHINSATSQVVNARVEYKANVSDDSFGMIMLIIAISLIVMLAAIALIVIINKKNRHRGSNNYSGYYGY